MAAVVGVLSFVVLGWGSWRPAWSGDEAATAMVVRRPLSGVLRTFAFDPALEPYYLLLKLWSVVSTSELWLRLPSVLAMATAVTVVSVLTARFAGRRAGGLAALVMLALPATSRYGQDARPYALSLLLVVMAVVCWDDKRLVESVQPKAWLAVAVILAGAAHPYALLIVPVLMVASWLAPRADPRAEVLATFTSGAVAIFLLGPFLVVVARGARES